MTDTDLHTRLAELCEKVGIKTYWVHRLPGIETYAIERRMQLPLPDLLARAEAWLSETTERRTAWAAAAYIRLCMAKVNTEKIHDVILWVMLLSEDDRVEIAVATIKVLEREAEDALPN